MIATAFFIFLTTFFTMYSNQKDTGNEAGVSDVVKAMIFFIQTLSIITQIDVDIPADLRSFSMVLNSMYSPANAFACVLTTTNHWNAALGTTLIRLGVPFGLFLALSPLWLLYSRQLHSRFRSMLSRSSKIRSSRRIKGAPTPASSLPTVDTSSSFGGDSADVSLSRHIEPPTQEDFPKVPAIRPVDVNFPDNGATPHPNDGRPTNGATIHPNDAPPPNGSTVAGPTAEAAW